MFENTWKEFRSILKAKGVDFDKFSFNSGITSEEIAKYEDLMNVLAKNFNEFISLYTKLLEKEILFFCKNEDYRILHLRSDENEWNKTIQKLENHF